MTQQHTRIRHWLYQFQAMLQVRSYTFSPDSGKIDCIRYDALGWPAIPERLVGVWEVGVECIQEIDGLARITLLPGAEVELNRISDGPLELAFVALQVIYRFCLLEFAFLHS